MFRGVWGMFPCWRISTIAVKLQYGCLFVYYVSCVNWLEKLCLSHQPPTSHDVSFLLTVERRE